MILNQLAETSMNMSHEKNQFGQELIFGPQETDLLRQFKKIEYSDFDIEELNMFSLDPLNEQNSSPEKLTESGISFSSKKSMKNSIRSHGTSRFKSTKTVKKLNLNKEKDKDLIEENLDMDPEPVNEQVPLTDLTPPREIPIEEKILRDRKEKQKVNQEREQEEKAARKEREIQLRKGLQSYQNSADIKNKKITYDHHGKILMIKTISEK